MDDGGRRGEGRLGDPAAALIVSEVRSFNRIVTLRIGAAGDADLRPPAGLLLLATLHGDAVGIGALRLHGETAEIKRMWVADSARGLRLRRRPRADLEALAFAQGARLARLETNKTLTEAIALCRSAGYTEVAASADEPCADHWFSKDLG
jgi:GNAT superfamily N-acetyltransferase